MGKMTKFQVFTRCARCFDAKAKGLLHLDEDGVFFD